MVSVPPYWGNMAVDSAIWKHCARQIFIFGTVENPFQQKKIGNFPKSDFGPPAPG